MKAFKLWMFALGAAALMFSCEDPETPGNDPDDNTQTNDSTGNTVSPGTNDYAPEAWYETNFWQRTDREKIGLRGPVKKWYMGGSTHREYEYDRAGHLVSIRDVDPTSQRGEWLTLLSYDEQGRLVSTRYGRTKEKGGTEFDPWNGVIEEEVYEYNNPGKYVIQRPDAYLNSRMFRCLGPDYRDHNNSIIKDLSAVRTSTWRGSDTTKSFVDYLYSFDADGKMWHSYHSYYRFYDRNEDTLGAIMQGDDYPDYTWSCPNPVVYQGDYPYSFTFEIEGRILNSVTAMTWRDNGMPLTMDGPDGYIEFSDTEKRYLNPIAWTCQEGNPFDALFGFCFWEKYTYNKAGDLVDMQERFNEDSDQPWTRPSSWEYEYDQWGNWTYFTTKYMVLINGPEGPVYDGSLRRTIEYFE